MYSKHSECFWKRYCVAWSFRGEPNSDHAVPTATIYSVLKLASKLSDNHYSPQHHNQGNVQRRKQTNEIAPERKTAICNCVEDSKCVLLSYDTVYSGRWVPTFQRRTPTASWRIQWERSFMKENRLSTVRVKMRSQEKVCWGEMKVKVNWGELQRRSQCHSIRLQ